MTFARMSEATATLQRVFHRSQNTFNRIQNSFMSMEIHDQGWFHVLTDFHYLFIIAETSFCWAFSISSVIRHSLNTYLDRLIHERPLRFDKKTLQKAITYLNELEFHKKLRTGYLMSFKKKKIS